MASLELTGKALWYVPGERMPNQILTIPSSWIVGTLGTTRFDGFKIRPPGHSEETIIPAEEAVFFYYPHPSSPRASASPLEAAGLAVRADEQIQVAQGAAFRHGIMPKYALHVGTIRDPVSGKDQYPTMTTEQRKQVFEGIAKLYAGTGNSGTPFLIDGLIEKIEKLSLSPAEMDFIESGKATKARICQIFGVNPIILGEVEGANRASSLAAEQHLAGTLNPKLRLIGDTITEWLAKPRFGDDLCVWLDQYEVHDPELELKQWQALAAFGGCDINELRAGLRNLPPVDWGGMPVGAASDLLSSMPRAQARLTLGMQSLEVLPDVDPILARRVNGNGHKLLEG